MARKRSGRIRHAGRVMIGVIYPNDDHGTSPRFFLRESEATAMLREGFADDKGLPINQMRLTFKRPIGLRDASCKISKGVMIAFAAGDAYARSLVNAWA
jgi:hypothetical protein